MHFTIEQDKLSQLLDAASLAIPTRPTDPILGAILLVADAETQTLSATSFNLSLGIHSKTKANIKTSGVAALPGKLLADTIGYLKGELCFELEESTCIISHSSGKRRIQSFNPSEFPQLPTGGDRSITLPVKKFLAAIRATLFAASRDETRTIITGVNFKFERDRWQAGATDSHRLALVSAAFDADMAEKIEFTVSYKNLQEIEKILSTKSENSTCTLHFNSNFVEFNLPNTRITSRLLEGEFPKLDSLIPTSFQHEFYIDKAALETGLKRVATLAEKKSKTVKTIWDVKNQQLTLYTESTDVGNAIESLIMKANSTSDEQLGIGFNLTYLAEAVKYVTTDEIVIKSNGASRPAIVCPVGGILNQLTLVMPVLISSGYEIDKPANTNTAPASNPAEVAQTQSSNNVESPEVIETVAQIESEPSSETSETAQPTKGKRNRQSKPKAAVTV